MHTPQSTLGRAEGFDWTGEKFKFGLPHISASLLERDTMVEVDRKWQMPPERPLAFKAFLGHPGSWKKLLPRTATGRAGVRIESLFIVWLV